MSDELVELEWHNDETAAAASKFAQRLDLLQARASQLAKVMADAHDKYVSGETGKFSLQGEDDRYAPLVDLIGLFDDNVLATKEFLANEGADMDKARALLMQLGLNSDNVPPVVDVHSIKLYDELLTESFEALYIETLQVLELYDLELPDDFMKRVITLIDHDVDVFYMPENKVATAMATRLKGYKEADDTLSNWLDSVSEQMENEMPATRLQQFAKTLADMDDNFRRDLKITDELVYNAQLPVDDRRIATDIFSNFKANIPLRWRDTEDLEMSKEFLSDRDAVLAKQFDIMVTEVESGLKIAKMELPTDIALQMAMFRKPVTELFLDDAGRSGDPVSVIDVVSALNEKYDIDPSIKR